jgi:hypothetical protein
LPILGLAAFGVKATDGFGSKVSIAVRYVFIFILKLNYFFVPKLIIPIFYEAA